MLFLVDLYAVAGGFDQLARVRTDDNGGGRRRRYFNFTGAIVFRPCRQVSEELVAMLAPIRSLSTMDPIVSLKRNEDEYVKARKARPRGAPSRVLPAVDVVAQTASRTRGTRKV